MTINARGTNMDTTKDLLKLPIHPWTGLTALGVLDSGRVVWPVLGGAEDDDTGEESDDEPETPADDDTDSDDTGDTDTSDVKDKAKDPGKAEDKVSRTELAKVIAARDRAKTELRDRTRELEELRRASETADDAARREAADEAQRKADAKYKPISVRAGLLGAGVKTSRVKGALKLLDMEDIDIDDDGEVSGLDTQLVTLRAEWPELFADAEPERKEERRRAPRADGADKKPERKELSASERQAARLLGKS